MRLRAIHAVLASRATISRGSEDGVPQLAKLNPVTFSVKNRVFVSLGHRYFGKYFLSCSPGLVGRTSTDIPPEQVV